MKEHNVIVDKSFAFAVRIVKLSQYLKTEHKEYILSKQVLRSGTSIGANVNEAQAAQSKKDFISKIAISTKEARETRYWLDLLVATDYLSTEKEFVVTILDDCTELIKLLTSIAKSSSNNLNT